MERRYRSPGDRIFEERRRREEENFLIFIRQLNSPGSSYRIKAAEALGNYGNTEAVPYLIECLERETDSGVLYVVVCSLAKLKDKSSVPSLVALLECEDRWIRRGAAKALGAIGDRDAILHIRPMLSDSNPRVRASAAEALGMMSYWDVVDCVVPLLEDENSDVRDAARIAVRRLGRGDLADGHSL